MARLMIHLEDDERAAIWRMAEHERCDPRQQAALIVRRELERLGNLEATKKKGAQPCPAA